MTEFIFLVSKKIGAAFYQPADRQWAATGGEEAALSYSTLQL